MGCQAWRLAARSMSMSIGGRAAHRPIVDVATACLRAASMGSRAHRWLFLTRVPYRTEIERSPRGSRMPEVATTTVRLRSQRIVAGGSHRNFEGSPQFRWPDI
jgi:hypothetical protein